MTSSKKLKITFTVKQWERISKMKSVKLKFNLTLSEDDDFYEYRTVEKNSRIHRIGGPAYCDISRTSWYVDGLLHREDGPAQIWIGSLPSKEYWLCGKHLTKQQFDCITAKRRLKKII